MIKPTKHTLQVGSLVKYTPGPRPNVVCPSCEASSVSIGEAAQLEFFHGKVGVISGIQDTRGDSGVTSCSQCGETITAPQHFRELGIIVQFPERIGGISGVWASPVELKIVGKTAHPLLWIQRNIARRLRKGGRHG